MKWILVIFLISSLKSPAFSQYQTGTMNKFEIGDAIYRTDASVGHGHTGIICDISISSTINTMSIIETTGYAGYFAGVNHKYYTNSYPNNYAALDFTPTYENLIQKFIDNDNGLVHLGNFTNNSCTPQQRKNIVSYAYSIVLEDPGYTTNDLIDPNGAPGLPSWAGGENWKGEVSDIDEIQCDGYVEYAYEKSGAMVITPNIGNSGNNNVNHHNNIHGAPDGFDWWDLNGDPICPKIQANLHHNVFYGHSTFAPSVVLPPSISAPVVTNATIQKYTWSYNYYFDEGTCNGPQDYYCSNPSYWYQWDPTPNGSQAGLNIQFSVSDNASVSAYILVQAKLPTETTWYTVRDQNNPDERDWSFNPSALTSWNGTVQTGGINIGWIGETTQGRTFSLLQMRQCQFKITAVDLGGNVTSRDWAPSTGEPTEKIASSTSEPENTRLASVYPNPFNPGTRITVHCPEKATVLIRIFDLTGKIVATLGNQELAEGFQSFDWNGQTTGGQSLSTGIYFARVQVQNTLGESVTETKKLTLLK